MDRPNTKEAVKKYIEDGGKCYDRYGFAFKGARKKEITKEEALSKLNKHCWEHKKDLQTCKSFFYAPSGSAYQ